MADGIDNLQDHCLVCQEPERPAGMSCGWCTTPECYQPCLPLAIQHGTPGGMGLFLPVEGGLKPLFNQTLSNAKHGVDTDGEALCYPFVGPGRTIRIGF